MYCFIKWVENYWTPDNPVCRQAGIGAQFSIMSEQLIPATITIADRSYRIKLDAKDEEVVRKTVKTINDKIIEFKTMFAGKDMQDYVAMALVWYATEQNSSSATDVEKDNLTDKLNLLERMLDGQLQSWSTLIQKLTTPDFYSL